MLRNREEVEEKKERKGVHEHVLPAADCIHPKANARKQASPNGKSATRARVLHDQRNKQYMVSMV